MYSVRKTTKEFGNTNINILIYILIITGLLIWNFGINYLIIFCSASLLHIIIETGLSITGIRKGSVYVYGYELPRVFDIFLRSLVEGPAYCVPAYFVADRLQEGDTISVLYAFIVVGIPSLYMGWSDRYYIRKLASADDALISRRAMTKPKAIMLLALINTGCLAALFLIPTPFQYHAFSYILTYAGLVLFFYFINYNLGCRYIEHYDCDTKKFYKANTAMQIAGLTYDSAYEMTLLVSPAYLLPFYFGLFQ